MLAGNPDVLLVTEVKLSDSKVISRIRNALSLSKNGPYELILNSGSSARGVGIIIKSSLFDSYTVTYRCPDFNALIVKFEKRGVTYQIVCNYLDNDDNVSLIQLIESKEEKTIPTVWGGDFNTVLDANPDVEYKIDLRDRLSHPGPKVSLKLANIRNEHGLFDAYREIQGDLKVSPM